MSNVLVEKQKIDILANAISAKSGEPVTMTLEEMVEAVDGIETGGGGQPNLQAKTYTVDSAGTATVTADSGYDGLSEVEIEVPSGSLETMGVVVEDSGGVEIYMSSDGDGRVLASYYKVVYSGCHPIQTAGYIDTSAETGYYIATSGQLQLPTQAATTITPTESSQTAVAAGKYTTGAVTVGAISSTYVGSGITQRSSSDLTTSGATVTVPAGYYSSQATKTVSSGTAGNPTATKGTVSNHSVSVTPSVTNGTGYITGGTKTGTAVTVSASELVSGSETKTENGTYDVTNLAELVVNVSGGGANFGTVTTTNSSNQNTNISFTLPSGRTPKAFFVRLTSTIQRSSSSRYYYVFDMRWDGSATGGVAGNQFYMYSGQLSNITSGYSKSQDGTTFTLTTTGTRSASPGSFYNGTYELVYVY